MKRLLLIFFLLPLVLSAQEPEHNTIEPVPEGILNLRNMAAAMSNDRYVKIVDILTTHNGEYATVAVFFRDTASSVPVELELPMEPDTGFVVSEVAALVMAPFIATQDTGIVISEVAAIVMAPLVAMPDTGIVVSEVAAIIMAPLILPDTGMVVSEVSAIVKPPIIATRDTGIVHSDVPAVVTVPFFKSTDTLVVLAKVKNEPLIKLDTPAAVSKDAEVRMPVAEMHLSKDGYSLLQKLEGYSPSLYSLNDGGFTIGFGFFVPFSEGHKWSKGISWAEAENIMRQKVPAYEAQVKQYINVPLTQNEFDALTMLAYNLGGFSKATCIINDINEQVDIEQLQRDWKRFVHSKAPNVRKGLMNRRNDEMEVRKISNYQPERKILIFKSRK
jgi:GH24 family phage-related lysozyme (muramidase)